MSPSTDHSVTDLLLDLQAGRTDAMERLVPVVYDQLREIAAQYLSRNRGTPTLQPTAVVHELYFRLVDQRRVDWRGRSHFFATAALLMRRLIVDHARRSHAMKRGGGRMVTLEDGLAVGIAPDPEVVRVHEALEELAQIDPDQARLVELRFFGGLTFEEVAEVMAISVSTAKREWSMARAWLHAELAG